MTRVAISKWLVDLAERKLGKGATVKIDNGQWIAESVTDRGGCVSVGGKTRDILVWALEQLPDRK